MPNATATDPAMGTNSVSKVDLAYDTIRRRIAEGVYTPGYRLILGTLAQELGVSSVPVREAIRRLEAESLVSFTRNVGATVRGLDPIEYRWAMETLAVVESAATGLAVPRLSARDIKEATRINNAMRAGLRDLDPIRHASLNQQFHRVLSAPCPNPQLLDLVDRGWTRLAMLRSSVFSFIPERAVGSVAEHDKILELIKKKAGPAKVEAAARAHREATLRAVLSSQDIAD